MSRTTGNTRRSLWIGLAALAVFLGVLATLPTPPERLPPQDEAGNGPVVETDFAVVEVLLFDGTEFRPNHDVWVEDGRIHRVGQRLALPDDLPRLDGRGHTLIPGLVDSHIHALGTTLVDSLRFGVTTVLDQFTLTDFAAEKRPAREVLARTTEADLFSAGTLATAPRGHGTQYGFEIPTLDSPEEAAEFVRARKAEGSDWIKIVSEDGSAYGFETPTLDSETVAALIEAAHAEGLLAVVHVSTLERGLEAVALGADGLAHIWADSLIGEEDAARFAEAGVFVIPTLSVTVGITGDSMGEELLREVGEEASPMQRQTLANLFPGRHGSTEVAFGNVARLHAAGVRVLAGADAPNPATAAGISMHGELRLLERVGLSPAEALAAATSLPAEAFGIPDRGRLEEGRIADLLLVRGDLSTDLTRSTDLAAVWKDGFAVERELAPGDGSFPTAPEDTVLSDFEEGPEPRFGFGWQATTDSLRGGSSVAEFRVEDGALVVEGEIVAGFAFPWAGAIYFPGASPMQPVDFSGRTTLRFRVRGDGETLFAMLFGADAGAGVPPTLPFPVTPEWTVVEIPLADFPADDPEVISAIAIVAQGEPRPVSFALDDLEIR